MALRARGNRHGQTLLVHWVNGLDEEPVMVKVAGCGAGNREGATRTFVLQVLRTRNNEKIPFYKLPKQGSQGLYNRHDRSLQTHLDAKCL